MLWCRSYRQWRSLGLCSNASIVGYQAGDQERAQSKEESLDAVFESAEAMELLDLGYSRLDANHVADNVQDGLSDPSRDVVCSIAANEHMSNGE